MACSLRMSRWPAFAALLLLPSAAAAIDQLVVRSWNVWPESGYYVVEGGDLYSGQGAEDGRIRWTKVMSGVWAFDATRPIRRNGLIVTYSEPVLYVSKGESGEILTSLDNGNTWRSLPGPAVKVYDLVADPNRDGVVFATGDGHLFRTTNAGLSWLEIAVPCWVSAIRLPEADDRMWILGYHEKGDVLRGALYSSTNDGLSWEPRMAGLPIQVDPSGKQKGTRIRPLVLSLVRAAVLSRTYVLSTTNGLFRSVDDDPWERIAPDLSGNDTELRLTEAGHLPDVRTIDEGMRDRFKEQWAAGRDGVLAFSRSEKKAALFFTKDTHTWTPLQLPSTVDTIHAVTVAREDTIILGNDRRMFFRRPDMERFAALNFGISVNSDIVSLLVSPAEQNVMVAYALNSGDLVGAPSLGIFHSRDAGQSWEVGYGEPEGFFGTVSNLVSFRDLPGTTSSVSPYDPQEVWEWGLSGRVSHDGGVKWENIAGGGCRDMQFIPTESLGRYCIRGVNEGSLFRSADGGKTWTDMSGSQDIFGWKVIVSPDDSSIVLASKRGIYISEDGGWRWRRIVLNVKTALQESVDEILPLFFRGDTLVVVVKVTSNDYHRKVAASIVRTDDRGRSWTMGRSVFPENNGVAIQILGHDYGLRYGEVWIRGVEIAKADERGRPRGLRSWVERTRDLGATWQRVFELDHDARPDGDFATWFCIFPNDPNHVLMGFRALKVESVDGGRSWTSWGVRLRREEEGRPIGTQHMGPSPSSGER